MANTQKGKSESKSNSGQGSKTKSHSSGKEHSEDSHKSHQTTDHDEIRKWAEARGGKPSAVKRTGSDEDPGIIRIDFPGYSGAGSLEEIPWEEWFEKFEEAKLALIYQEETAEGERSNFNKLVKRHSS